MNLELLDPFRRQIPDRVDATLSLPVALHFRKKPEKNETDDQEWKAANHVAFNRRGSYIAVGYGSGTVGVFDVLSRTLSALYRAGRAGDGEDESTGGRSDKNPVMDLSHGVTSLSWSRRSRTLLAGAAGDTEVRLIDTTNPLGPEECCLGIVTEETKDADDDGRQSPSTIASENPVAQESSFARLESVQDHFKRPRYLEVSKVETTKEPQPKKGRKRERASVTSVRDPTIKRYASIIFQLPIPVGGSLQIHPKNTLSGIAALTNGSLVAFSVPQAGWEESDDEVPQPKVKLATIYNNSNRFITCATFDPHGEKIYAATKEGQLLGFEFESLFDDLASGANKVSVAKPSFTILIPGGATVWHLLVSRNGRYLVVNSADAGLRLYATKDCWTTPEEVEKPTWVFQDVVSKVKFASCDLSGDAEYVVGGANGNDNKYELYIWNTSTGALMDKLTGAPVQLYSVAWHPTRSFLAVSTSDGLVDIWGPRINWTAFAPDFQALPQNVEYVEREDEFDVDDDDKADEANIEDDEEENEPVDVVSVEPVPVFASDSEDEEHVFYFETKVTRRLGTFTS